MRYKLGLTTAAKHTQVEVTAEEYKALRHVSGRGEE